MGHSPMHGYFAAQLDALAGGGVLRDGAPIALAVSGGPDSMCLAQLCIDCAAARHPLHILTVDHGLRPEAADEAQQVCDWAAAQQGVTAHLLHWRGGSDGNVQERARLGRYALMAEWCVANKVALLMTAHHQDDQAETVLMRLGRGSGVDGLSAMRGQQILQTATGDQIKLLRPLLGVPKQALDQFSRSRKLPVADDPSNRSDKYLRSRHRAFLASDIAERLGLSTARLAQTARTMQRAADALDAATDRLADVVITPAVQGYLTLDLAPLFEEGEELRLRLLRLLVGAFSPGTFPIEEEQVQRLWHWLAGHNGEAPRYTIRGLLLEKAGTTDRPRLFVMREPRAVAPAQPIGDKPFIWDGRFRIMPEENGPEELWCLPAAALGVNRVRDGLAEEAADLFAAAPPMARGTVPVLARIRPGDEEADIIRLLTDQDRFVPHLRAKSPLILPSSQEIDAENAD